MFYVYAHYRADDPEGLPFYIGKGKGSREHSHKRNPHWKNIVSKHGFIAKKIKENLTEQEAWDLEKVLIQQFGKLSDHTGCLCNLANGGEGASGTVHSDATKLKWSNSKKGKTWEEIYGIDGAAQIREKRKLTGRKPHSKETIEKIRQANSGSNSHMFGKKLSPETREKLSKARKGKPSPTKGKKYTEETRQNYKKAAIIREANPVRREQISKKLTGIKRSKETKRKMSEAAKLREAKKKLLSNNTGEI